MSNQRRIVRETIKKQPGYSPKQDFAQQITNLYEARITAASSAKDMQGIKEDLLNHKKENRRYRRRFSLLAHTAAAVVAIASAAGGAVAAVAATASLVPGADLLTYLIVGATVYTVGYITLESSKAFFQMEKNARDKTEAENTALTGLENKLQQKLSLTGQPSATTSRPAKKISLLGRLRSLFKKSAEKPADSLATPINTTAPAKKAST